MKESNHPSILYNTSPQVLPENKVVIVSESTSNVTVVSITNLSTSGLQGCTES
jgi:hypothetical protein